MLSIKTKYNYTGCCVVNPTFLSKTTIKQMMKLPTLSPEIGPPLSRVLGHLQQCVGRREGRGTGIVEEKVVLHCVFVDDFGTNWHSCHWSDRSLR